MATPIEQIQAMGKLSENWDGYGAAAPQAEILTVAASFLETIQQRSGYVDPDVVPTRTGGVLLAWECGPHQLEVEFESPHRAAYVYLHRETDESATGILTLPQGEVAPPFAFTAILSSMPVAANS